MVWVLVLMGQSLMAQTPAPTQIERGEALFFDTASGGCANCHMLKGRGTAVGPDLKPIARVSPAGIATAIRSTVTQYVQVAKTKAAGSFPTMPPAADAKEIQIYDLSKMPPEPHKLESKSDFSLSPNSSWKHPPTAKGYTDQQMADIIAYVRYAAVGIKAPVNAADVK